MKVDRLVGQLNTQLTEYHPRDDSSNTFTSMKKTSTRQSFHILRVRKEFKEESIRLFHVLNPKHEKVIN